MDKKRHIYVKIFLLIKIIARRNLTKMCFGSLTLVGFLFEVNDHHLKTMANGNKWLPHVEKEF